jgi:phosphoenolpyruvate carboxylase
MVLEDYLSVSTDNKLAVLKQKVTQAIEFFKLIISNVDQFLDKIDDIIIMYYDFLMATYKILKAYLEVVSEK